MSSDRQVVTVPTDCAAGPAHNPAMLTLQNGRPPRHRAGFGVRHIACPVWGAGTPEDRYRGCHHGMDGSPLDLGDRSLDEGKGVDDDDSSPLGTEKAFWEAGLPVSPLGLDDGLAGSVHDTGDPRAARIARHGILRVRVSSSRIRCSPDTSVHGYRCHATDARRAFIIEDRVDG